MKIDDVRRSAYSMPLTNPSFPPGPCRFFNREFLVITYRTDLTLGLGTVAFDYLAK